MGYREAHFFECEMLNAGCGIFTVKKQDVKGEMLITHGIVTK